MKDFHCKDVGLSCDFVARGKSVDKVLEQAAAHARDAHDLPMSRDLRDTVESLIHDEESPEHQQSLTRE